ncbi:ribonucleoside hydrolase RihC [Clostridium tertium]|uniref:Ribonucleoside hydrolase RihC n=1 Tax=Clostridium tertium TaxID=1559 RepID=A0A6N3GKP6_9CLOT
MLSNEEIKKRLLPPKGRVKVVLDADAYNEVDDQFEITWAFTHSEKLDIQAIYAAPFNNERCDGPEDGMLRSYKEVHTIMDMAGIPNKYPVYKGSTGFLTEENTPINSDAVDDLIRRANSMDGELLYVIATGAITNVASALIKDPSIAEKIVVIWLGGQPLYWSTAFEFNLSQDKIASRHVLDCGVPLVLIPTMSVASRLSTTSFELDHYLKDTSKSGEYLRKCVSDFMEEILKKGDGGLKKLTNESGKPYLRNLSDYDESEYEVIISPKAKSKIIWDIAVIAFLVNPLWTKSQLVSSPILKDDDTWELTENRHPIRVVMYLDRDAILGDMFYRISKLPK